MHELLILVSLKSHLIVGAGALILGGYLGFQYGGYVEAEAQAAAAKTASVVGGILPGPAQKKS